MDINLPEIELFREESVVSLNETGKRMAGSRQISKAEESFLKAIETDPAYPPSYQNLGIIQAAQSKFQEAVQSFEKLIELEPDKAGHYANLGIVYFLDESFADSEF